MIQYHGLRGLLIFDPTESTPLDRSPKNLLLVNTLPTHTAEPNLVQIRPSGRMGEIYRKFYLFIYLFIAFWGTHLQVRPVDGFSRLMAQTMRTRQG